MKRLAIFASGNGSNAENIIRYFNADSKAIEVVLVVCNKPDAAVVKRANKLGVPVEIITRNDFQNQSMVLELMKKEKIDLIILAGFLLMVPSYLIDRYKNRIINIHPSLLPAYGGKGMYGRHVHEAVFAAKEKETGITIHIVTDKCDEGAILFQAKTPVSPEDTPESIEIKIHALEKEHFPKVIEEFISNTEGEVACKTC